MTTETAPVAQPPARPSALNRAWEWLWRGQALQQARAARAASANVHAHTRASIAHEVAQQVLDPASPWLSGKAHHLAAALFIEALGWALRALPRGDETERAAAGFAGPPERAELEELVRRHEAELLAAAEGKLSVDHLRELVLDRSFASGSDDEAEAAARVLAPIVRRLLELERPALPNPDRILQQRAVRSGGLALLFVFALLVRPLQRAWLEPALDLAAGKPWVASSNGEAACESPAQRCSSARDFFFHTKEEENPWLEIDLQAPRRFSALRVINRQDCCGERAVPLVAEVSTDHQTWRQVAHQSEPFDAWHPRFPALAARWLRLRVPRRSHLHLYEVRVLP